MCLKDDLKQMTPYERRKLQIDSMRFIAMILAPFIAVVFNYVARRWLGW